jgi:hypothetical protein
MYREDFAGICSLSRFDLNDVDQSGSIGYIIQHPLGPTLFHSVYLLFSSKYRKLETLLSMQMHYYS